MAIKKIIMNSMIMGLGFLLLGPPIGGVLVWLLVSMWTIVIGQLESFIGVGDFLVGAIITSYFIGGMPALVTGILVGIFKNELNCWKNYFIVGFLAIGITSIVLSISGSNFRESPHSLYWLGFLSFISGTLVARIFRVTRDVGHKYEFEKDRTFNLNNFKTWDIFDLQFELKLKGTIDNPCRKNAIELELKERRESDIASLN